MGEATYYMKARFSSEEAAQAALPKLKAFIDEGLKAEEWWQDHRDWQREDALGPAKFFEEFQTRFPQVYLYLKDQCGHDFKDCNNRLAGLLNFGDEETDPYQEDDQIRFSGVVWHCADWTAYENWLRDVLGAVNAGWVSDEYIDPMDLIEV